MKFKGIERGDKTFRHFTFDDEDIVKRAGKYYYKVNYGKNKLEGEFAEDEFAFVLCEKVVTLGGKKPKMPVEEPQPLVVEQVKEKETKTKKVTKTTKTKKSSKDEVPLVSYPSLPASDSGKFEYCIEEIFADNVKELQIQLNEKGEYGWDMCGFDTNKNLFGKIHIIAIFKRKRD